MRTTLLGSSVTLLSCALALVAGSAHAQDAAPPPAAPPPAAPPAADAPPPAAVAPAPEAPPPAPPAAVPPPEAAPPPPPEAPAEDAPIPAWIRFDSDGGGLQVWAGATHPLGEGIGLASDIYLATGGTLGEFDIGPAITAGPFLLTPMVGLQVNWSQRIANSIVPQLYFVGGPDPIYMEFWFQAYLNTVFDDAAANDIYMRLFIDYKVGKYFAFGPEIEPTIALNDYGGSRETGMSSFLVGGNVLLTNYGKGSSLMLFLGYETKESARDALGGNALGGRFTYVYNF